MILYFLLWRLLFDPHYFQWLLTNVKKQDTKRYAMQLTADDRRQKGQTKIEDKCRYFYSAKSAEKKNYLVCAGLRESAAKRKEY